MSILIFAILTNTVSIVNDTFIEFSPIHYTNNLDSFDLLISLKKNLSLTVKVDTSTQGTFIPLKTIKNIQIINKDFSKGFSFNQGKISLNHGMTQKKLIHLRIFYYIPLNISKNIDFQFLYTDEREDTVGINYKTLFFNTKIRENNLVYLHLSPSPFKNKLIVDYGVKNAGFVSIQIFDATGRLVKTLVNEPRRGGSQRIIWYGLDDYGRKVSPGIYLFVYSHDNRVLLKKQVILLK